MLWHSADCWFCEKYIFISPGRWSFPAEIVVYESFSLKMYIRSEKAWFLYVCMLCFHVFAHMYVFIWNQTSTLSKHAKIEFHFKRLINGIVGGNLNLWWGLGAGAKDKNLVGRNFSRWGNDQIFGCNNANLPALTRCHLHFKVFTPPEQLPFHLHAFLLYQTHQWVMNSECCFLYRSYWIVGNWLPKLQSHLPK